MPSGNGKPGGGSSSKPSSSKTSNNRGPSGGRPGNGPQAASGKGSMPSKGSTPTRTAGRGPSGGRPGNGPQAAPGKRDQQVTRVSKTPGPRINTSVRTDPSVVGRLQAARTQRVSPVASVSSTERQMMQRSAKTDQQPRQTSIARQDVAPRQSYTPRPGQAGSRPSKDVAALDRSTIGPRTAARDVTLRDAVTRPTSTQFTSRTLNSPVQGPESWGVPDRKFADRVPQASPEVATAANYQFNKQIRTPDQNVRPAPTTKQLATQYSQYRTPPGQIAPRQSVPVSPMAGQGAPGISEQRGYGKLNTQETRQLRQVIDRVNTNRFNNRPTVSPANGPAPSQDVAPAPTTIRARPDVAPYRSVPGVNPQAVHHLPGVSQPQQQVPDTVDVPDVPMPEAEPLAPHVADPTVPQPAPGGIYDTDLQEPSFLQRIANKPVSVLNKVQRTLDPADDYLSALGLQNPRFPEQVGGSNAKAQSPQAAIAQLLLQLKQQQAQQSLINPAQSSQLAQILATFS